MLVSFEKKLESMKVILGSSSPRRKELLKGIIKKYEVVPSEFDESTLDSKSFPNPVEFVKTQARKKCEEIEGRIKDADMIITADTIVTIDDQILGKPHTHEKAYEMVSMLSGRSHTVVTGVYITFPKLNKTVSFAEETLVFFDKLDDDIIKAYTDTDDPLDKAGAYGIQSGAMSFIYKIEGDYYNVMGFPVHRIAKEVYNILLAHK